MRVVRGLRPLCSFVNRIHPKSDSSMCASRCLRACLASVAISRNQSQSVAMFPDLEIVLILFVCAREGSALVEL